MVFGALIIFFLIVEPHGLARLWQIAKEKLRLWPFLTHVGSNEAQLPPLSYPRPPMLRPPPLPAHSAAAEAPPRVRPF